MRSSLLSFYGHLGEDDEVGARMEVDFINLKFSREDMGLPTSMLPPTLTSPLRGVEQNTMQRPICVNVWDTESLLCTANTLGLMKNSTGVRESSGRLPQTDSVAQRTGSLLGTSTAHDPQSTLPSQEARMLRRLQQMQPLRPGRSSMWRIYRL